LLFLLASGNAIAGASRALIFPQPDSAVGGFQNHLPRARSVKIRQGKRPSVFRKSMPETPKHPKTVRRRYSDTGTLRS